MDLTRRDFVVGAATATVSAQPAAAEIGCTGFDLYGVQRCTVGIRVYPAITARQRCHSWCWAASIETVFAHYGFIVPQEAIVERLYGGDRPCTTATGFEIVYAIEGNWIDQTGRRFYAEPYVLLDLEMGVWNNNASAQAAQELTYGRPLINGALGHATVMTAMTFLRDVYGPGQPIEIIVRDPWPGFPNRRRLSVSEAFGTFFLVAIHIFY